MSTLQPRKTGGLIIPNKMRDKVKNILLVYLYPTSEKEKSNCPLQRQLKQHNSENKQTSNNEPQISITTKITNEMTVTRAKTFVFSTNII